MYCGRVFCKDTHSFATLELGLKGTHYLLASNESIAAVCMSANGLIIQDNNGKTKCFDPNTLTQTADISMAIPGVTTYLLKTFDAIVPNCLFFANCSNDPQSQQ